MKAEEEMKLRLLGEKKNENRGKKNRMEKEMSRKKAKKKGEKCRGCNENMS